MKKGQGVQFNWIFVIVTGAIILVFFAGFGTKYIDLLKSRENADIARGIDIIINGLKGQEQAKSIDINTIFLFENKCSEFIINNQYIQDLNGKVLFSEKLIKAKKLYAWTREFRKGFKVDNLLYLIDSTKKIYFVEDFDKKHAEDMFNGLPKLLDNVELVSQEDLELRNLDLSNARLVYFASDYDKILEETKLEADFVILDSSKDEIIFRDRSKAGVKDDSLVYGAIFSGNYKSYKCGIDLLEGKFENIRKIYYAKAKNLEKCCSNGCEYSKLISALESIKLDSDHDEVDELLNLNRDIYDSNRNFGGCRVVF